MADRAALMEKLKAEFLKRRTGSDGGKSPAPYGPGGRFGGAGAGPKPGSPFPRKARPAGGAEGENEAPGTKQGVPFTAGKNPRFDARFGAGMGPPGRQAGGNPMAGGAGVPPGMRPPMPPRVGLPPGGLPVPPGQPNFAPPQAPGMPDRQDMLRRPPGFGPGGGLPPFGPRYGRR